MRGKNSTVNKCVFSCSLGKKNREITRGERWFVFFSVLLCNRIMRFIYALCEFFFLAVKFHLLRLGTGKWWNKYINKCINKKEARVFCGNWFSIIFFFFFHMRQTGWWYTDFQELQTNSVQLPSYCCQCQTLNDYSLLRRFANTTR